MSENQQTTDKSELRRLHDGWIAANMVAEVAWLEANLHPDFVMYNNNGSNYYGIEPIVELWKSYEELARKAASGSAGAPKASLKDKDVRVWTSGDLGVVSYQADWKVDFGEHGQVNEVSRGSEVFVRTPSGWKMIHFHASPHKANVMGGE